MTSGIGLAVTAAERLARFDQLAGGGIGRRHEGFLRDQRRGRRRGLRFAASVFAGFDFRRLRSRLDPGRFSLRSFSFGRFSLAAADLAVSGFAGSVFLPSIFGMSVFVVSLAASFAGSLAGSLATDDTLAGAGSVAAKLAVDFSGVAACVVATGPTAGPDLARLAARRTELRQNLRAMAPVTESIPVPASDAGIERSRSC